MLDKICIRREKRLIQIKINYNLSLPKKFPSCPGVKECTAIWNLEKHTPLESQYNASEFIKTATHMIILSLEVNDQIWQFKRMFLHYLKPNLWAHQANGTVSSYYAQREGPLELASRSQFLIMQQQALLMEGSIQCTNQTNSCMQNRERQKKPCTLRAALTIGAFNRNGSRWLKSTDIKSTWNPPFHNYHTLHAYSTPTQEKHQCGLAAVMWSSTWQGFKRIHHHLQNSKRNINAVLQLCKAHVGIEDSDNL